MLLFRLLIFATLLTATSLRAASPAEQKILEAIKSPDLSFVHLWAPWCSNCQAELKSGGWLKMAKEIFFFQAEDGIRYHCVTGVQTCALPIWIVNVRTLSCSFRFDLSRIRRERRDNTNRSEERRVGKECRTQLWPLH